MRTMSGVWRVACGVWPVACGLCAETGVFGPDQGRSQSVVFVSMGRMGTGGLLLRSGRRARRGLGFLTPMLPGTMS